MDPTRYFPSSALEAFLTKPYQPVAIPYSLSLSSSSKSASLEFHVLYCFFVCLRLFPFRISPHGTGFLRVESSVCLGLRTFSFSFSFGEFASPLHLPAHYHASLPRRILWRWCPCRDPTRMHLDPGADAQRIFPFCLPGEPSPLRIFLETKISPPPPGRGLPTPAGIGSSCRSR